MSMPRNKPIDWIGSSFKDLCDDEIFPEDARRVAGYQLRKVQRGDDPDDWKPFDGCGSGYKRDSHQTVGRCLSSDVCGQVRGCHLCVALLQKENAKDQSKGQEFVYPTLQRHDADQEQKMSTKKIITHRTPADGNIFADLGFAPDEAQRLLAEADMAIDEKRALKQTLMTEIVDWIDAHNLKQAQAAEILGITRPRVSDVVNQKTPKFTVDSLVDMVLRTGKHVQLSVQS